ncbi:hypothetical protein MFIFM68171_02635 [Madurella fahalii]|uniref:Uncharacterized protein n=1 Tax=Madurella fahalii TaxID=1157608 RepID=A0ABQ0G3S8_9PEZI
MGKVPVTRVVITSVGRLEVEVGRGSCVTRVVTTTTGGLLDDDGSLGSSVSLVGITLRDEVAGAGPVATPVETPAAAELAGDVVGAGSVVTAVEMAPVALLGVDGGFSKL